MNNITNNPHDLNPAESWEDKHKVDYQRKSDNDKDVLDAYRVLINHKFNRDIGITDSILNNAKDTVARIGIELNGIFRKGQDALDYILAKKGKDKHPILERYKNKVDKMTTKSNAQSDRTVRDMKGHFIKESKAIEQGIDYKIDGTIYCRGVPKTVDATPVAEKKSEPKTKDDVKVKNPKGQVRRVNGCMIGEDKAIELGIVYKKDGIPYFNGKEYNGLWDKADGKPIGKPNDTIKADKKADKKKSDKPKAIVGKDADDSEFVEVEEMAVMSLSYEELVAKMKIIQENLDMVKAQVDDIVVAITTLDRP